jgi:hypothetical protein
MQRHPHRRAILAGRGLAEAAWATTEEKARPRNFPMTFENARVLRIVQHLSPALASTVKKSAEQRWIELRDVIHTADRLRTLAS